MTHRKKRTKEDLEYDNINLGVKHDFNTVVSANCFTRMFTTKNKNPSKSST